MFLFAQLLGIFITAAGLAFAIRPQVALAMVAYWEQGQRIYFGGLIRLSAAGILILAAPYGRFPLVLLILGILFLISGILLYALPETKLQAFLAWYKQLSTVVMRVMGAITGLLGLLIIYSI